MPETTKPLVWISHRDDERCAACGITIGKGNVIQINAQDGLRCATCAGFGDLVYLPSGDPALTRRAVAHSSRSAVVVQFSRARKRNERRGSLVEPAALERAEAECREDSARREALRARRRVRDEAADRAYVARFAEAVVAHFPHCPREEADAIARRACEKSSGRVGRSAAAKAFDAKAITLAVRAHVRHQHTPYDELLAAGHEPSDARPLVAAAIEAVLARWREKRPGEPPA
jgi:hypothetical protein